VRPFITGVLVLLNTCVAIVHLVEMATDVSGNVLNHFMLAALNLLCAGWLCKYMTKEVGK
jgi:hypothetical protein